MSHKLTMKVISAPVAMTSPSGALLQVFNASPKTRSWGVDGGIYLRRNGAPPTLLKSLSGKQTMVGGPLVLVPGGVLMTYMVRNAANDTSVPRVALEPRADDAVERPDRPAPGPATTTRSTPSSAAPMALWCCRFVYAKTSQVHTRTLDPGRGDLDRRRGLRGATRLNQPRTIMADAPVQAGIMEPVAVEVEPGQVAILFRCAAGYLGRVDLDLASRTLGEPYLTNLQSPLAGLSRPQTLSSVRSRSPGPGLRPMPAIPWRPGRW